MIRFSDASIEALIDRNGYDCACGRHHQMDMDYVKICSGAVSFIPEALEKIGAKHPFVVCDVNTKKGCLGQGEGRARRRRHCL